MNRPALGERGAALLLALAALVTIGAFVSWTVFLGLYAHRGGENVVRLAHAFSAAEEGVWQQVAHGDWGRYVALAPGGSVRFRGAASGGTGSYRGAVTRIGETLFLVSAEGFDTDGRARQHVGLLVARSPLPAPGFPVVGYVPRRGGSATEGEPGDRHGAPSIGGGPQPLEERAWIRFE